MPDDPGEWMHSFGKAVQPDTGGGCASERWEWKPHPVTQMIHDG